VGFDPRERPLWVKQYGSLYVDAREALEAYGRDVRTQAYPDPRHATAIEPDLLATIRARVGLDPD
jgi:ketopantoate hydroxymethyltransferase